MADIFYIDDSDIRRFIFGLNYSERVIKSKFGRQLRILTKFAENKMKLYTRFKASSRSTGKLHDSIKSKFGFAGQEMYGEVFVPPEIRHQLVIEYGAKRQTRITGRPYMTFSAASWKKGVSRVPHRGYFVFTQVTRGRFRGKFFTQRAYDATKQYYDTTIAHKMGNDAVQAIAFGR